MPKYLIEASYTLDGVKGLIKDGGSKRRDVIAKACASGGGRMEAFYFAFGATDAYVLCDLPSNAAAAALSLTVSASGAASCEVICLLTPEEIDQAAKLKSSYTPPGA